MRRLIGLSLLAACSDDPATPPVVRDAGADVVQVTPPAAVPDAGPVVKGRWSVERPPDSQRWWMVSPSGERVFVLGVDSVLRDDGCNGIGNYLRRAPPSQVANQEWARLAGGQSGTETDPKPYGFNSAGAFSDINDLDATGAPGYLIRAPEAGGAGAPYSLVVSPVPQGDDRALKDTTGKVLVTGLSGVKVGDPWNPEFRADIVDMAVKDVAPRYPDRNLQIIYLGSETGMFDLAQPSGGVRDFRRWIWSDCPATSTVAAPACAPHAFVQFLYSRYPSVAVLNTAWESAHASIDAIATAKPVPYAAGCNLACREDLQRFVHERMLPSWINLVTTLVRSVAGGHVIGTPRLALGTSAGFRFWAPEDRWADSGDPIGPDTTSVAYDRLALLARFDVVAINLYSSAPLFEEPWLGLGLGKLAAKTQLPIVVSEMGIRARIDGWSNKGGADAFVDTQIARGERYASQLAQLAAHPEVVGVHWNAWSDRYLSNDAGLQINRGLVQCDDPTRAFVAGARWAAAEDLVIRANADIRAATMGR